VTHPKKGPAVIGIPQIVAQRHVTHDGVELLVSTIRIERGRYDTCVFDDSPDKRHHGKRLPGHEHDGHHYGPYVIGKSSEYAATREQAMDNHREALYAARTDTPA
jgi:hypothetical protein